MEDLVKHNRVELRIQGDQEILNPRLVEYQRGLAVRFETAGIGFQEGLIYKHFIPVFSWANRIDDYFYSDRPNEFTSPGGVFRVFDIGNGGILCERKK